MAESDDGDPTHKFRTADYALILPVELDKYGMPLAESYRDRVEIMRDLLAAGLSVSWYTTEDEQWVIVRVSGSDDRLSQQAESLDFLVRSQDKYRDNYVPENETFVVYKQKDRSLYSNAFVKFGPYRFCSLERQRLVHSIMFAPNKENGANMGGYSDKIVDIFAMHDPRELQMLEELWFGEGPQRYGGMLSYCGPVAFLSPFVPEKEIRDYFGEKIALYCVFASFYTERLAYLCPFGILCTVAQFVDSESTWVTPVYAICVALWATLFLEGWKQRESSLRNQWNVEDFENNEEQRPEYYGEEIYNPILNRTEIVFNPFKRYMLMACSAAVLVALATTVLLVTLTLMVVRAVAGAASGVPGMVMVGVVNFVLIEVMNKVYVRVAMKMTDWENHSTQTEYDDQLIAKCFIFQFFNSYCSFFYLAFLEGNVKLFGIEDKCIGEDCMLSLSVQLMTIFFMHTFLGQAVEVIWPWCQKYYDSLRYAFCIQSRVCCRNVCKRLKAYCCNIPDNEDDEAEMDALMAEESAVRTEEELNAERPNYPGVLVDYNELVLQYGYVVLFAPAFPLASVLALFNNSVELRTDGIKLCQLYRRPDYICAQDIGSWQYIIEVLSVVGVITNAFIIAFTSSALSRFHIIGRNDRLAQIAVAFMAEHVILFVKIMLHVIIEDDPEHVLIRRKKREYMARKELRIEETHETEQEKYEFRQRFVEAPDEYEFHVDLNI